MRPESPKVVRPGGSQRGSQRAMVWPTGSLAADRLLFRPDITQVGDETCERPALPSIADVSHRPLLLLSSLLSAASRVGGERDWVVRVLVPQLVAVFR